jgi:hypothetical protein
MFETKLNKVSGSDALPPEFLKYAGPDLVRSVH